MINFKTAPNFYAMPDKVWYAIAKVIEQDDYECVDNCRAYKVGDKKGKREFQLIEEKGCCGSYSSRVTVDGEDWIIGFNHGH